MIKIEKINGLVAAPFTPFDRKGELLVSAVPEYYSMLESNGVTAAFINGSTGEGASMTQKEKQRNTEEWARCYRSGGKVSLINLVGGTSYNECIENAIHSHEEGIPAIAVIAPYYYKPDASRLAEFVTLIGEAVPGLPVYFYHIPVLTGVNMPMIGFLEKISGMLDNFAGIKYTQEDFMDFLSCLKYREGAYDMLWGRDECLLSALVLGAKGAVGSTYNYATALYLQIIKAFNDGDIEKARILQKKSVDMISLLGKYGGIATGKAYMRYIGMDCGNFRSPVFNMTENMYDDFVKEVKALGMDEYFSKK